MKLIIFDYENNEQYEFNNVSIKKMNYYLENYKNINAQKGLKKEDKYILLFFAFSILYTSTSLLKVYGRNLLFDNDNLYKSEKLVVDNNEVESICNILEDELGVTISDEEKDEYLLLNAINKNKNLTDAEKEIYYQYIDMFLDNPYLNKEEVYHTLLNVDILYKKRPIRFDSNISGSYESRNKTIEIYEDSNYNEVLKHEMFHSVFYDNNSKKLPNFFIEGMTEFLANEYFAINPYCELRCYPLEISAIKMLCEVTSSDTVLKAFTYNDMDYIVGEMANYIGHDASKEVIETLDFVFKQIKSEEYNYEKEDIEKKCIARLRECINKKYGNNYLDQYSYYYNENLFNSVFDKEVAFASYSSRFSNVPLDKKVYFSSKLKNKLQEENEKVLVK